MLKLFKSTSTSSLTTLQTVQPHRNKSPTNPNPPPLQRSRVLPHSQLPQNRHPSAHTPPNPNRHPNIHPLRLRTSPAHPHPSRLQHRHLANRLDLHLHAPRPAMGGTSVVERSRHGSNCICAFCACRSWARD